MAESEPRYTFPSSSQPRSAIPLINSGEITVFIIVRRRLEISADGGWVALVAIASDFFSELSADCAVQMPAKIIRGTNNRVNFMRRLYSFHFKELVNLFVNRMPAFLFFAVVFAMFAVLFAVQEFPQQESSIILATANTASGITQWLKQKSVRSSIRVTTPERWDVRWIHFVLAMR